MGPFSPEAAGDYASGPNHVLPTGGAARQRGGLAVTDFLKVISVQQLNEAALRRLARPITTLARAEGLEAHARSVEFRLERGGPPGLPSAGGRRRIGKSQMKADGPKEAVGAQARPAGERAARRPR